MTESRKRITDVAFVLVLMLYVLLGVTLVPAHGDESMLIHMAGDFFTSLRGQWDRMAVVLPVQPDTDQHLRLLNGTLTKLTIGAALWLSGKDESSLPGIYAWALPQSENIALGNVPSESVLAIARLSSAVFTALGVIPMFLIGWHFRLRLSAYPAAALYALHPTILLNGRRAMMEGSLLFFSLMVMLWVIMMIVAEHDLNAKSNTKGIMRRLPVWGRYVVLGGLCGLTIASKHTGLVTVGAGLIAVPLASLLRRRSWQPVRGVVIAGAVTLATFLALNPAYWRDPVLALRATIDARAELLSRQVSADPLRYAGLPDRLSAILTQPYLAAPQFYEAPTWADRADVQAEIAAYQASTVSGWHWGNLLGAVLSAFAGVGLLGVILGAWRRDLIALAILIWVGATFVYGLSIPFAWSRYYLPVIEAAILLAANGLGRVVQFVFFDLLDHLPPRK